MNGNNRKSAAIRHLIVRDRKNGLTFKDISKRYEISMMGAKKICDKQKIYGTVNNLIKSGRPRKSSLRDNKMIIREVKKNPAISARAVKENLNLAHVHERTVRRRLNENGLNNYIAKNKPFINARNQKKRLLFAKQHFNKPLSFWKSII